MFEAYRLRRMIAKKAALEKQVAVEKERLKTTEVFQKQRAELDAKRNELRQIREKNSSESVLGRMRSYTRPAIQKFEKKIGPALKQGFERAGRASTEMTGMGKTSSSQPGSWVLGGGSSKKKKRDGIWG